MQKEITKPHPQNASTKQPPQIQNDGLVYSDHV